MLTLQHIRKEYVGADYSVKALDDISLAFRKNEFVAVLGPSGSGKTTLLNIVGGLDHYTSGDLVINGKSTKNFTDGDWDSYRNHTVGFVFQSYNLIPHQSVLANVELALTLSGVKRKERRQRAKAALEKVGLGDQLNKRPNQMSGGQMQRVAIARALVNDPDILLADEPTGALDSATSVQIMDLIREISRDRLVIMVTHNPELADQYANRIVRMKDGVIVDDTNPFDGNEPVTDTSHNKRISMSFFTALSLSLNNLMTKKARTFLTGFAGSIGIFGIAMILSLSSGIKAYINQVQEETLSSYPVEIVAEQKDMSSMITQLMGAQEKKEGREKDRVYASSVMYDLVNSFNNADIKTNDLKSLREYFEAPESPINDCTRTIQYLYDVPMNFYARTAEGDYQSSDMSQMFQGMTDASSTTMMSQFSGYSVWSELLTDRDQATISDIITSQYEIIGTWPESKNDVVLVLDKNNEISDITLYALGLKSRDTMLSEFAKARKGEEVEQTVISFAYDEILGLTLKLVPSVDFYAKNDDGKWEDKRENADAMDLILASAPDIRISGIARPLEDANLTLNGSLYYTHALTEWLIEYTGQAPIVKAQLADPETDVFSSLPFTAPAVTLTEQERADAVRAHFETLDEAGKQEMYQKVLSVPDEEALTAQIDGYMATFPDRAALEEMIFTQYTASSGMTEESILSFLDQYNDDELTELVRSQIRTMLIAQQEAKAEATVRAAAAEPSEQELTAIKASIAANLPDKNTQMMFIVNDYVTQTGMPAPTVMAYLAALPDAEFAQALDRVLTQQARTGYAQAGMSDPSAAGAKIAAAFDAYVSTLDTAGLSRLYDDCMPPSASESTYNENLKVLGVSDAASPSRIVLYSSTFADKDNIKKVINDYNADKAEDDKISYTDYVGLILSGVTKIIDVISYVLIAFVSVSLLVSSIMIGIITYISVLERTKEIGVLRAIGASKRDISRVFNAETLIIGLIAGLLGIGVTVLLCIPVNIIVRRLADIPTLTAYLPWVGAIALMFVSIFFTVVAGLLPSSIAAKKDPVEALRTE